MLNTYVSSRPDIVIVPEAGLGGIRSAADGSATITVNDSAGHVANYPVTVIGNRPPIWELTDFEGYNWNGWQQGPAGMGAFAGLINDNGAYSYLNRTRGDEGSYAGVILHKQFYDCLAGRRYRIVFHFLNRHENSSQNPIISVTVNDVAVMQPREITERGWITLDNYFVAASSQLSVAINNHQSRGDAGNDYQIDNLFFIEQVE